MFGIGIFELLIIAVVALIFVGPKRLPELMRQGGKLFVQLRRTTNDVKSQFDGVIQQAEEEIRKVEREKFLKLLEVQQELQKSVIPENVTKVPDHPTIEYQAFVEPAAATHTESAPLLKGTTPTFDTGTVAVADVSVKAGEANELPKNDMKISAEPVPRPISAPVPPSPLNKQDS